MLSWYIMKCRVLLLLFWFLPLLMGAAAPSILLIDSFKDGNISKDPNWWQFGSLSAKPVKSPAKNNYSLLLKGQAKDWYVGGIGTYLAQEDRDFSEYNFLRMDIYGNGANSGKLTIELYEDDNNNWQVEQNPSKQYAPIYDDRFLYELPITWKGWKQIKMPLSEFKENNSQTGDDSWNPEKAGESGGLLQMQIIALAASKTGKVNMVIEDVAFVK